MSTSTWARVSRTGAIAAVGALAVALLPTVAAQAAIPAAPNFAYRSTVGSDVALSSNNAAASGTVDAITQAGYQVYGYDAADNGQTWAACMASGAAAANSYDRTYALVLVHKQNGVISARSLSTFCEANPVVSRNGDTVWWYADDQVYKFAADYSVDETIGGTASVVSTGQFVRAVDAAGDPTENVLSLAVSPNGANASVLFTNGSTNRVRSAFMSTAATKPGSVQVASSSAATMPKPSTFVYVDDTTLLYSQVDSSVSPAVIHNVTLVTPPEATPAGTAAGSPTDVAALQDLYDVRPHAGTFWAWKDAYTGTTWDSTTLYNVDGAALTAQATATTRADGATTYSYVPVTSTPPALNQNVQNRAAAHPYFATSASLVAYKKRAAYSSYNLYETDPLGGAFVAGSAAETDRGLLSYYFDGMTTYAPIGSTSGASVFAIGSRWYNGWAQLPGRTYLLKNTWFRWTFPGDFFTEPAAPITRQVKVTPAVSARKSVSGRYTTLYGTATRAGGTAVMQRLTSRGWRTVTTAVLVKKGSYLSTYTFGRRALPKAAYRIVTVADRGWAAGISAAFRL